MSSMVVFSLSDLPADILQTICQKLTDIKDYIAFGAVCSQWRSILWLCHKHIPTQLPLLMFPNTSSPHKKFTHSLFSINSSKLSVLPNTTHAFATYIGLNHGWVLALDYLGFLYLVNPFLSGYNLIKLPFLKSSVKSLMSAVLSDNPTSASKYVLMVTYTYVAMGMHTYVSRNGTSFFRSGEKSWSDHNFMEKVIYYKDQFYGIDSSLGEVVSCDTSSVQPKVTKVANLPEKRIPEKRTKSFYLAESCGELLCLVRRYICPFSYKSTSSFQILKLRQTATLSEWDLVKDLKGHALFIANGGYTSFSVLASNFRNCRANGIYFTEGCHYPRDVKLFDLYDSSIVNLFNEKDYSAGLCDREGYPAIWIQPSLNMIKEISRCDAYID